jgi:hypothetical protein
MPLLKERARVGTKLRLLCPITPVNSENVDEFASIGEVRANPGKSPGSVIMVVDDAEVLICHYVPDDEHLFKGEDIAIWSDDKAIVRDMKATILANWDGATVQIPTTMGKTIPVQREV